MDETLFFFLTASPAKNPERCATPFYMATVGATLEYRTVMALQMEAVNLFKPGVADELVAVEGGRPIIDFIRDAAEAGAELYVCSGSLAAQGIAEEELIPECTGVVGGTWMIEEAGEADLVISY
ncbi:MAG: DsrE family protein [Thiohalorhabdus sp.]|uniref:DsrE family protein n=1 Tax=Thiohalorhabdus sp. TaxID=3094134 RepID=UPI0039806CC8